MNTAVALFATAVLAVTLSSLGIALDDMDDRHAEWAASQSLMDAQVAARNEQQRQRAARAICRAEYGEADIAWTPTGDFVCQPRRGRAVVAQVQP